MRYIVILISIFLGGCTHSVPQEKLELKKVELLKKLADKYPDQSQLAVIGIIAAGSESPVIYNNNINNGGKQAAPVITEDTEDLIEEDIEKPEETERKAEEPDNQCFFPVKE